MQIYSEKPNFTMCFFMVLDFKVNNWRLVVGMTTFSFLYRFVKYWIYNDITSKRRYPNIEKSPHNIIFYSLVLKEKWLFIQFKNFIVTSYLLIILLSCLINFAPGNGTLPTSYNCYSYNSKIHTLDNHWRNYPLEW